MKDASPTVTYLKDYKKPAYLIESTYLQFDLHNDFTRVLTTSRFRRNPDGEGKGLLELDGTELKLINLRLNGEVVDKEEIVFREEGICIAVEGDEFELEIETEIYPQKNTALEGLYVSNGMYCTQCEAEGFRRITYFLDRPDVMTRYTTKIVADKKTCPVMLSNGNPTAQGELENGRHWVEWQDPFPKPSYLFALVAGDLVHRDDKFVTASGREVTLKLFVEAHDLDKCEHALESLKRSMRWDEDVYGREYDLDIFMIVAVSHFNMGAMENKGLNIFNAACVLAKPQTATDDDYENIEGIIGHEYFHNWSGNRVTCRDWFQLSLKEGFTVYRDQEFSSDMGSRAVKRITEVNVLRTAQFAEDSGPMAHPVRPESYMDISNFYTVTIYNKGAEVIRMIHTLLGDKAFRKGSDLYFERHDGQAVTTEDFVKAMEDASGVDLARFRLWYSQAGTPRLNVSESYDANLKTYTLTFEQTCPATPKQETKDPFHIPVWIGLLDSEGLDMPLNLSSGKALNSEKAVLHVTEREQSFTFVDLDEKPTPSLLRDFSAPVIVEFDYSDEDLMFLMAHDRDSFNRWDAGQRLSARIIKQLLQAEQNGKSLSLDPMFVNAFKKLLLDVNADAALISLACALPNETYLAEQIEEVDPVALHKVRKFVQKTLAVSLEKEFVDTYHRCTVDHTYRYHTEDMARRSLRNRCLAYLTTTEKEAHLKLAMEQYKQADNMTDSIAAVGALVDHDCPQRDQVLDQFYQRWQDEQLALDKWFSIQSRSDRSDLLDHIEHLLAHPAFDVTNPNKLRAVYGGLAMGNPAHFH
ncbi:MAG: aminopeptidase N, partial [Gammaproteobacteria bacterium]|nr:aminopeptidase N [Gammaproteobacteria bacterium]